MHFIKIAFSNSLQRFRGDCSYGGESAQFGRLARFGEISPSLTRKIHYAFKWIQLNGNVKIG